jgi:SAM domain (Sterile alpha motif)
VETTVDVGAWLLNLGLGQYEAAFRENEIEAEVLPDLTDADLEKLGVPMGHRKRLLKAITRLSSADWEHAPDQSAAKIGPKPHDVAERRQLTIMFCDLVGSTALPRGSIPRICAGSSPPIISAAPV